jgi:hypothetical protein
MLVGAGVVAGFAVVSLAPRAGPLPVSSSPAAALGRSPAATLVRARHPSRRAARRPRPPGPHGTRSRHPVASVHRGPARAPVAPSTRAANSPPVTQPPQGSQEVHAASSLGYGCAAADAYLEREANPAFAIRCPGYALGHEAMTCLNIPGVCPGTAVIIIADPCPQAYENEAWNSWHLSTGPFDPYGWCATETSFDATGLAGEDS